MNEKAGYTVVKWDQGHFLSVDFVSPNYRFLSLSDILQVLYTVL